MIVIDEVKYMCKKEWDLLSKMVDKSTKKKKKKTYGRNHR